MVHGIFIETMFEKCILEKLQLSSWLILGRGGA